MDIFAFKKIPQYSEKVFAKMDIKKLGWREKFFYVIKNIYLWGKLKKTFNDFKNNNYFYFALFVNDYFWKNSFAFLLLKN